MASERDTSQAWFAYIATARRGCLETLEKLASEEPTRDRGASCPSLLDTFAHSPGALFFWRKDVVKFSLPAQEGGSDGPPTSAEVRRDETYTQTQNQRVMTELTGADLARTVFREEGRGSPREGRIPVREVLWHLVEEELQHRGELNALLWQIDVEPPVHDWIRWAHDVGRIRDLPPN